MHYGHGPQRVLPEQRAPLAGHAVPTGFTALAPDLLQLAGLAAASSNAASSTAYAVDAVVKEAVHFFAIQGPLAAEKTEDVFKVFGQRAHVDAHAAEEACALAHQLVASLSRGGSSGRGNVITGGSIVSAALAAGRVGTHADRTAATARECAQLCMGILEDAVQVNASPLAREAAKRCAEQALHSIQAASIAEQHSRALRELLARTLSSAEVQARATSVAGLSSSLASTLSAPGPTSPLLVPLSGDGLLESPRSPSSASPEPGRWWEVLGVPANNATIASRAGGAPQRPQDQKCLSAQTLQESLDAAELRCTTGALDEEDQRALRTMVEWRYGQALASGLREEELLTDSHAVQLASWHAPEGQEASASLPAELLDAAQRCGGSLTATLDAAFREPEDLQEVSPPDEVGFPPFRGAWGSRKQIAEEFDWDLLCDKLGWRPFSAVPEKALPVSAEAATANIAAWSDRSLAWSTAEVAPEEAVEDSWSVDTITSRQLHVLSMRSRSSKITQKKVTGTGNAPGGAAAPAACGSIVDDEDQVQSLLTHLLGDWDHPAPEMTFQDPAMGLGPPLTPGVLASGSRGARASTDGSLSWSGSLMVGSSLLGGGGSSSTSRRGNRKKKQAPGLVAGQSALPQSIRTDMVLEGAPLAAPASPVHRLVEPAHLLEARAAPASPVHRLVEPAHLLEARASQQEDEEDEVDSFVPMASLESPARSCGWGSGRGPSDYLPGQLLQQRLPRTFNESMGFIARERREAYGMPSTGLGGLFGSFNDLGNQARDQSNPLSRANWLLNNRARTFNGSTNGPGSGSSPIQTPVGTFIATPTWSDSGDFAAPLRDDPCSPLYVQATPHRWASEHCEEVSQVSPGFEGLRGPRPPGGPARFL